jgi:NosR/NirI family transcriptional regulator, nitrous oxide reductase regulator
MAYNAHVRVFILTIAVVAGALVAVAGQAPDAKLQNQLKQLFPGATSFSPKGGDPQHIKAFAGDPKLPQSLLGFAFYTTELQPLERAYDGPIKILVGMDTKGILNGIIVVEHNEPYGDFSIDPPAFARQFVKKNIRDTFRVGADIDAVSRATISVTSASRAVRNSARRIARQFLAPPETSQQ